MESFSHYNTQETNTFEQAANSLLRNVYIWMTAALVITGLTAFYIAFDSRATSFIFSYPLLFPFMLIGEIALVIVLSHAIGKLTPMWATVLFIIYSIFNGVTMSSIFFVYELGSIATTFFAAAASFGSMALIGSYTKKDLTSVGNLCTMALIGLLIALIVNLFIKSSVMEMVVSGIGVLLFVGLTAYDSQKIKEQLYNATEEDTATKLAILGALSLYLDFINIFLYLLRFLGKRR